MKVKTYFTSIFLTLCFGLFVSCDKDFNEIGASLIDDIHYQYEKSYYSVVAYDGPTGVVQTNNLPVNSLGFYNNSVFGSTTASFVTQIELDNVDPKFYGVDSVSRIDSVYLYIPYFSRVVSTDATTGDSTFDLDSIHGKNNKLKLSVYRSEFFLRNLDPNSGLQEQQRYYNDEKSLVENISIAGGRLNNSSNLSQNDEFVFSSNQIKLFKTDSNGNPTTVVRERFTPGIYMDLDKAKFFSSIFQAPAGQLVDNNAFRNYFKGLYFKAESVGDKNAMARLNFAQGKIVIIYKGKDSNEATTYNRKSLTMTLRGNSINFLENTNTADYSNAINSSNPIDGDEKLYLKGGQGSMAFLKLFSGSELSDLRQLYQSGSLLINEANLVFTVDNARMNDVYPTTSNPDADTNVNFEPNRIYLYDLNNKRPLLDYNFDTSTGNSIKFNKFVHDGILRTQSNRGIQYKVRITNHIRRIIQNSDSTNVNIGLVVTESINNTENAKLRNNFSAFGTDVKFVPTMSVASPLGTILWGNNIPISDQVNYPKRLRLELVYTKPD